MLFITACTDNKPVYHPVNKPIPRNLAEAINYLDQKWTAAEKLKFKSKPEEEAVDYYNFSTGLWIRNNWIYAKNDSTLASYFHKLGVVVPDDMSGIILLSFHRALNNKPIDLDGQVNSYKAFWKKNHRLN